MEINSTFSEQLVNSRSSFNEVNNFASAGGLKAVGSDQGDDGAKKEDAMKNP